MLVISRRRERKDLGQEDMHRMGKTLGWGDVSKIRPQSKVLGQKEMQNLVPLWSDMLLKTFLLL
jgi:hypothetical protein